MKTKTAVPFAVTLVALICATGCQQTSQHSYRSAAPASAPAPAPAPRPAPAPAPAPAPTVGCTDSTWGLIKLSKTMPVEAALGMDFEARLSIVAQGCAANVVVRDTVPAGASFVRSEPAAAVEDGVLVWKIGNMDAGQVINARVWFKADKEGTLVNCATVSADPRVCAGTFVGKPVLTIDKTGPETAILGADVTYNILVKNTGTTVARNVVVTDAVPEGLSGQPVTVNVGDLAPGQSKTATATFKTTRRGKVCNTATANSSNAGKVGDEACTVVLVPGLKVEKTGTKEQILGRNADYTITVSNTGDTTLNNVIVSDTAPAETTIVTAPGATITGNKATWTIANLAPGAKVNQTVRLTSKVAGSHCNNVTASASGMTDSATACTLWKGIAAVLLEVVDDPDPIQVGESTTYTIKVTNQGFADINNMKIEANFGDRVQPVSTAQGRISGQAVTFPTVAKLAAKQVVTYTITVKGATVGDSRNKVVLNADELRTPVEEEESTTVY